MSEAVSSPTAATWMTPRAADRDGIARLAADPSAPRSESDDDAPTWEKVAHVDGAVVAYVSLKDRNDEELSLELLVHSRANAEALAPELGPLLSGANESGRAVYAYVDEHAVTAPALLERIGFTRERVFVEMRKELHEDDRPAGLGHGPDTVTYESRHEEATRLACNEAFESHWGTRPWTVEQWAGSVTRSEEFYPDLSFLHLGAQGEVDSFVLASRADTDSASTVDFDLVGTRVSAQRRGLATRLLRCALGAARAGGFSRATLIVDSDGDRSALKLYESVGFTQVGREFVFVARGSQAAGTE
jgi:mycothiol synthase